MKVDQVPQDRGMMGDDVHEVCYSVGEDGRYQLTPSIGWEPKNITNDQAWEVIRRQVEDTLKKIESGHLSPLAYHMVNNQMNLGLLSKYMGINRWRVRRHLKPAVFKKLKPAPLKKYADIFGLSVEQVCSVPRRHQPGEPQEQQESRLA